ncbi:MAG TPA: hypothetical protein VGR30_18015, partial [Candidatus Binatia bacterium]|nr:hypothetical protein [Candidatus Binatia bacterium]
MVRWLRFQGHLTVTGTTRKFVRDKRQLSDAFLRGYLEGMAYVQTHRDVTIKVMGKYTRQRDPEVLEKYYEELIGSLPRIPYIEEAS